MIIYNLIETKITVPVSRSSLLRTCMVFVLVSSEKKSDIFFIEEIEGSYNFRVYNMFISYVFHFVIHVLDIGHKKNIRKVYSNQWNEKMKIKIE